MDLAVLGRWLRRSLILANQSALSTAAARATSHARAQLIVGTR
jgi:hypothetical protein